MQQYKFLLVSRRTEDAAKIRTEIERNKLYKVEHVDFVEPALNKIKARQFHCLIYNFDSFTNGKRHLISNVFDLNKKFPIVVFATFIQKEMYDYIKKFENVVIVEKPFEAKDLWGICEKMMLGKGVAQRIHRRFYVNQEAKFEKHLSGESLSGKIFNLSRGGAYFELRSGTFKPGDVLKISIFLDKVSRSYDIDGEVVWTSPRGVWQGKPAVGVKFIKTSDIYRNLLSKI